VRSLLQDNIPRQVQVFKSLGHETRARIVAILADEGEKCVTELVERLGFDQSTISRHLGVLKVSGIVDSRKEGLNVVYNLAMPCVRQFMKCLEGTCDHNEIDAECILRY
jgi:DNA-binding transcriptional ArsR family regulator